MPRTALALARSRSNEGDAEGALASLRRAEALAADDPQAWREIGQLHAEYWRWDDADRALERATALDPTHAGVAALHAIVKQESGDDAGALDRLDRAAAHRPDDLGLALASRLYLPQVYVNATEPARWRARFERGLADLEASLERLKAHASQVFELNRTNFLLAYQGEDDLELQRRHSRLLRALAGHARPDWVAPRDPGYDGSRRLRVGFAGSIFRDCTAGRYFERWITRLDPRRFERVVYHMAPIADDFTRRIAGAVDRFVTLRDGGEACIATIAADRLDVLVQPEVGMTPLSYLLAALRVAPVQCAGWGHPVTTGGDGVDAYFTCGAMEPDGADAHYSERLVRLPGLGVSYPMPEPSPPFPREQLRLPADRRLYVCPQSLFKIHPDMDDVFARLLEADPGGAIVFFQAPARAVTERFAARIQRALAQRGIAPGAQLKFLPRMNTGAFRRALATGDVVVDTVRWSGGNTSLDAIAAGTPVVTLPGRFMRARQTAAMLRMIGLDELVADSIPDLVARAVSIARDAGRNRDLRRRIAERRGRLFDQEEPIEAFAEALLRLGSGMAS